MVSALHRLKNGMPAATCFPFETVIVRDGSVIARGHNGKRLPLPKLWPQPHSKVMESNLRKRSPHTGVAFSSLGPAMWSLVLRASALPARNVKSKSRYRLTPRVARHRVPVWKAKYSKGIST